MTPVHILKSETNNSPKQKKSLERICFTVKVRLINIKKQKNRQSNF